MSNRSKGRDNSGLYSLSFVVVLFYFWIGLDPFPDPNALSLTTAYGGSSNVVNQIIVILITGVVLLTVWNSPFFHLLLRPHGLLLAMLAWFLFTAIFSGDPSSAFRRIVFAILVCICSNALLLVPSNTRHFAKMMCFCLLFVVLISYFGVAFMPRLAIHQTTDAIEPSLAGDWRGHFGHKNVAAAAMVYAVFFGLYVMKAFSWTLGGLLVILSSIFVINAGGKTSAAMLPCILTLAWAFERFRLLRIPIVVLGIGMFNLLILSAATCDTISDLVASIGLDPTFTGRDSVWRLALAAILDSLWTGYGFQSFWQMETLVASGRALGTWAVTAANSHNGYVEQLINGGVPALILVVVWLLILPIRYANRALAKGDEPALTRLFLRMWLFSLYFACLESRFFANSGPLWISTLMSVFGLRLQAYAQTRFSAQRPSATFHPAAGSRLIAVG